MARRKMSTEERHAKQKEKLTKAGKAEVKTESTYVAEPNLKITVSEEATKKGYDVRLIDSVLLFECTDDEKQQEIQKWLLDKYGRETVRKNPVTNTEMTVKIIPFSYGFGHYTHSSVERNNTSNDDVAKAINEDD